MNQANFKQIIYYILLLLFYYIYISSTDFSILHTNIRSLPLHHDEFVSLSDHINLHPKVIGVSEIWHSMDKPLSSNVDIPGYTFFKTQSLTQNGGVGLYIKDSLTSNPRTDLDSCTNDFETIWVEIENKYDKNFVICCVHRHPRSAIDNLTSHFQNVLSKLSSNKLVFIMGDFDINLLEYASHTSTSDFVNNFFSHSLLPCTHHPTRVSEQRASVQISDHFPQFLIVKNTQVGHDKSESFKYDYSTFKEDKFLDDFNHIEFTDLENSDLDVNKKFDRFLKDLNTLTNQHAPIKRRSRKEM